jgi:hypothetical protein
MALSALGAAGAPLAAIPPNRTANSLFIRLSKVGVAVEPPAIAVP